MSHQSWLSSLISIMVTFSLIGTFAVFASPYTKSTANIAIDGVACSPCNRNSRTGAALPTDEQHGCCLNSNTKRLVH